MFYEILQKKFLKVAKNNNLFDKEITIKTRALKPEEAIGNPDRDDFPLLKGKEVLMEAEFGKKKGQAYTDAPSEFSGPLKKIADLELNDSRNRALFIAALNAVMRHLDNELPTIHCKDNEPEDCAEKIVDFLRPLKPGKVGLIGLQPAILEALVKFTGSNNVFCVDRDEKNRTNIKFGVTIDWGDDKGMGELFQKTDLILATGSTVVNGSLNDIVNLAEKYQKPLYFYGTTIAGTAQLMNLKHLCFQST